MQAIGAATCGILNHHAGDLTEFRIVVGRSDFHFLYTVRGRHDHLISTQRKLCVRDPIQLVVIGTPELAIGIRSEAITGILRNALLVAILDDSRGENLEAGMFRPIVGKLETSSADKVALTSVFWVLRAGGGGDRTVSLTAPRVSLSVHIDDRIDAQDNVLTNKRPKARRRRCRPNTCRGSGWA